MENFFLAQRNVRMWDFTPEGWRGLWQHGFPLLNGVPGPYTGFELLSATEPPVHR